MTTTFTIDSAALEAMLAFVSTNRTFVAQSILQDVLCEITPDSVRLVATDTHTLGLLHLTPILGYHLDIACQEPTSLVLPVEQFRPVLKDRKLPVTVTLDGESVTITASSGLALTLPGRPAEEFPQYTRVLALDTPVTPTARTAYDGLLLAKFAAFAKVMGQPPHLDLAFHGVVSPVSIRIAGLAGFYGILMPRQMAYEEPIPGWLLPSIPPVTEEPRVIRLHDVEGDEMFTGTDGDGCVWTQFVVDNLAEQAPGTCAICGAELQSGWLNMDNGGEEICERHVEIIETDDTAEPTPRAEADAPAEATCITQSDFETPADASPVTESMPIPA